MRRHRFTSVTDPLADHEGTNQTGDRRVDMHHGTTCEVERPLLEQEACGSAGRFGGGGIHIRIRSRPVPHHMRHRHVGERKPDHHEHQNRGELGPFGEGTHDQAASNRRKSTLEDHEDQLGNHYAFTERRPHRFGRDALQEQLVEGTKERATFRKGKGISVDHPEHCNQRKDDEHLHQHRKHVLGADQTTVEQCQAGNRHQDNQRSADHDPCVVAFIRNRRRGRFRSGGGCRCSWRLGNRCGDGRTGRRILSPGRAAKCHRSK